MLCCQKGLAPGLQGGQRPCFLLSPLAWPGGQLLGSPPAPQGGPPGLMTGLKAAGPSSRHRVGTGRPLEVLSQLSPSLQPLMGEGSLLGVILGLPYWLWVKYWAQVGSRSHTTMQEHP